MATKEEVKVVDRAYLLKQFQNYNTKVVQVKVDDLDSRKVEKVEGMGLSQNSFSDEYKAKLEGLSNYDDTGVKADIKANTDAIALLNDKTKDEGGSYKEGSIAKVAADTVAKIVADAPEDYDTLKEISDWISGHAESAAAMNTAIGDNKTAIEQLQKDVGNISVEDADIDFTDLYGDGNPDITLTGEDSVVEGAHITLNSSQSDVTWTSSDESKATVVDGVVTGVSAGTVTITATKANYTAGTKVVTVTAKPTITVGGADAEVLVGSTITLTSNAENTEWTSGNDAIATVSEDGVVTGVSAGTVTITASAEGYNPGTKSITVKVVPVITLSTADNANTVKVDETLTVTSDVEDVTWTSSDDEKATVADGVVTGVSAGTVTITATKDGYTSGSLEITVEAAE